MIYKIVFAVCIVGSISCKQKMAEQSVEDPVVEESSDIKITSKQFAASGMEHARLELRSFEKSITVNGKIHLPNKSKAIVSSVIEGKVGPMNLVEGQWVKRGQQLFSVVNPKLIDLQEEYLVLQSQIQYLKGEQERKEILVKENLSANKEYLKAQSEYETALVRYQSIGEKLKLYGISVSNLSSSNLAASTIISAPISGYVSHLDVMRGQYVSPTGELLEIESRSHMHLELNVLERDASLIQKGQRINFKVEGKPSEAFAAKVHLINPSINEEGMVVLHCHIDNDKNLLPGMYATADIILEGYDAYAIQEEAVVDLEGKDYVLSLISSDAAGFVYEPVMIERGVAKDGFVEILNVTGLLDKDLLAKGAYYVVE